MENDMDAEMRASCEYQVGIHLEGRRKHLTESVGLGALCVGSSVATELVSRRPSLVMLTIWPAIACISAGFGTFYSLGTAIDHQQRLGLEREKLKQFQSIRFKP